MVGRSAHAHGLGVRINSVQLQVSSVQLPMMAWPSKRAHHRKELPSRSEQIGESVKVSRVIALQGCCSWPWQASLASSIYVRIFLVGLAVWPAR